MLKREKFVDDFSMENDGATILVGIENTGAKKMIRVSKPGRRVYANNTEIPVVLQGHGLVIMSTSKGVMSGKEARKQHLGGEVLCKVW